MCCLKENDKLIGLTFLTDIDMHNRIGHCPILLGDKDNWGKGLATETRLLILHHAFYDRGLHRIWARVLCDNVSSIRLHEKCGYFKEGEFRQSRFKNGKFINEYFYAVLKEDFIKVWNEFNEL